MDDNTNVSLAIHFNDGTHSLYEFPRQTTDSEIASHAMRQLIQDKVLFLEQDGGLTAIPLSSVKYIRSWPRPLTLPSTTLQGAELVE